MFLSLVCDCCIFLLLCKQRFVSLLSHKIITDLFSASFLSKDRALKHPAAQSSRKNTDEGFAAWAVDGNDNTDWSQNSCTMTRTENNPWWRVDLGSSVPVTDVFIVNRDCGAGCANQFRDFEIRIGKYDVLREDGKKLIKKESKMGRNKVDGYVY